MESSETVAAAIVAVLTSDSLRKMQQIYNLTLINTKLE